MCIPDLGIDISKATFDVSLLQEEKASSANFPNTESGAAKLSKWLTKHKVVKVHACMEATGTYWELIANYLYEAGHTVSVVNPASARAFAQSELLREKTDPVDAGSMARYCRAMSPSAWKPAPAHVKELQGMVRRLEALKDMRVQELNRRKNPEQCERVISSISDMIVVFDDQIKSLEEDINDHINSHPDLHDQKELLVSIPGLADTTAAIFLAEVPDISLYSSARQLAADAGLTPCKRQSGTSIHSRPHISKVGKARLRRALFLPAQSARCWNPIIRAFCDRLSATGKPGMVVIVAAMRKLIHMAYGVLTKKMPFDPNFLPREA